MLHHFMTLAVMMQLQVPKSETFAEKAGMDRGLVVLPAVQSAARPLQLANDGYMVYALCQTEAAYEELAGELMASGHLGQRIYLDVGSVEEEAIFGMADAVAVDEQPADPAPYLQMLAPRRGVMVAGSGVKTVCPAPEGGGQWRHRQHAPDNRRVSEDRLVSPTNLVARYYSLPLREGFWGTTIVAAGGRSYTFAADRRTGPTHLIARSLHNGCELWRKSYTWDPKINYMSAGIYAGRSLIAAADDGLWVGDGADARFFDGETGTEKRVIPGPLEGGQIKWLVLLDDALAVLSGQPDDYLKLQHQLFVNNPAGTHLAVYETNGTQRWSVVLDAPVDEREIASRNGLIYAQMKGVGTAAYSVTTGTEIWRNIESAGWIDPLVAGADLSELLDSDRVLLVDDDTLVFSASWKTNVVAMDSASGALLWNRPRGKSGRSLPVVLKDGVWHGNACLDARTGAVVSGGKAAPQSVCSITMGVGDWFVTAFSDFYEIDTAKRVRYADQRVPCDMGNLIVDGTLFGAAIQCDCATDILGMRQVGIPGDLNVHDGGVAANRLTVFAAAPAGSAVTAADWPTHRQNVKRTGSTGVNAPAAQPTKKWEIAAQTPSGTPAGFLNRLLPSGAVHAGGKTAYIDRAGVLRCVDTTSGSTLWSHWLGARSFAPPVFHDGMLFAADMNGAVHAFSAATGGKIWRFAAAPAKRKLLWYGQLISLWPCTGGLTIHDGVLYTVAGYQEMNGIHAYALNPANGSVIWESHDAGTGGAHGPAGAFGNYGHLTIGADRLWVQGGTFYPASFALSNGTWQVVPAARDQGFYLTNMRRGKDIGILGDFVLLGGMRWSNQQDASEAVIKNDGYNAMSMLELPVPVVKWNDKSFFGVDVINYVTVTPAWDEHLFVTTRRGTRTPAAWAVTNVIGQIQSAFDAGVNLSSSAREQIYELGGSSIAGRSEPLNLSWENAGLTLLEVVLCPNAAVALGQISGAWKLCALSRTDGSILWQVDLPSKPLHGGLSVAADGTLAVVFDDGSVRAYK